MTDPSDLESLHQSLHNGAHELTSLRQALHEAHRDKCPHTWHAVLQVLSVTAPGVGLYCNKCKMFDDEFWTGGIVRFLHLDLGNGITVRGTEHNSKIQLVVPVDIRTRQTVVYNAALGTTEPQMEVEITIKEGWELPPEAVVMTTIEGETI